MIFSKKISAILLFFAENIDCGHTLEPRRGSSNEYPQPMFSRVKITKYVTPANPSFINVLHKSGMYGGIYFLDILPASLYLGSFRSSSVRSMHNNCRASFR